MLAERALDDAIEHGNAILKTISANDVGRTGSHQSGFYLPKAIWKAFTLRGPIDGENHDHLVSVTWPDERITDSRIVWYGKRTRSEYRMTRFGRGFPYLDDECVGNLLVLVRTGDDTFNAHVLDLEADIEALQAGLGVDISGGNWAHFDADAEPDAEPESDEDCILRQFREYSGSLGTFPPGAEFSRITLEAMRRCFGNFERLEADKQLVQLIAREYALFRMAERVLCQHEINRLFKSIDHFLQTAQGILQRRKSRAGRALENHVEHLLKSAGIPHEMRPAGVDGRPDIVIPSAVAYLDPAYPVEKLVVVGVKTTCKDRWRQVLNEAKRVPVKHILTMQAGISAPQLEEMTRGAVQLVVPRTLHKFYPTDAGTPLMSVSEFIVNTRTTLEG